MSFDACEPRAIAALMSPVQPGFDALLAVLGGWILTLLKS